MKLLNLVEQETRMPMRMFVDVNIYGRLTMTDPCGDALATMVVLCDGDHLEIGVAHGGSAILCAYAKRMLQAEGHIHAIDPLDGYDREPNRTPIPPQPTLENVQRNIDLHGLTDNITLHKGMHPPLPAEIRAKQFVTAFIDGAHDYVSVLQDWNGLKNRVTGMIAFHDIDNRTFGAHTVFIMAQQDPNWVLEYQGHQIGIVRHVDYELKTLQQKYEELGLEYVEG